MPDQPDTGSSEARPVTYNQASMRYGARTYEARERHEELSRRHHLARAHATLVARGEYDPAKHGTRDAEPPTAEEYLELLAVTEYLSRAYKPSYEVDVALRAGASWPQVADALGMGEAEARQRYREWADGQHRLHVYYEGKFGMSDAEYAEAITRTSDSETYPGGIGDPANIGIRAAAAQREAGQ